MNQIIIFYEILRLILSKKTTNINFTGKNFFFGQNWYLYHHCCSNFIQQSSVDRNSNYHFLYLPFGVNCKCFYIYVESVSNKKFFWFGRNAYALTRLPLILLLRLNKLRVPMHNSVNRLWIFDVSWNPKAISKIVLTGSTVKFRLRRFTVSNFTRENTFAALNLYTLMKFSRYFSICLLDWI